MVNFDYNVSWKNLVNVVELERNIDTVAGFGRTKSSYKLNESVTDYGQQEIPLTIRGLWSGSSSIDNYFENNYLRRWFYAFGNPPGEFKFNSLTKNIIYDPGDHVSIDSTNETDLTGASASSGWTGKQALLTSQDISLTRGNFNVSYGGLIFDILDKVSGFHTNAVTIAEGSINTTENKVGAYMGCP